MNFPVKAEIFQSGMKCILRLGLDAFSSMG